MLKFVEELLQGETVTWKRLGEVATLERGKVYSKEYISSNSGEFPVYSSQTANNGILGKINSYDYDGNFLTWTTDGAYAGTVFHRKEKFSITNVCGLITVTCEKLDIRFLFYWLSIETKKHVNAGMGNPKLMSNQVEKILIPIPPLRVQEKIVEILDKYTALEEELEEKLKIELALRKNQYEYYRNKLLTFGEEVEWKRLGEVGSFVRGNGLQKKDFTQSGVGCIHYGQIYTHYGMYTENTISYVSEEAAQKFRKAQHGDLIIAVTSENLRDVCKTVVWGGEEDICVSGETYIFKHNQNAKFLAYYLQTPMFYDYKRERVTGTKVIRIHERELEKFRIPLPPLSEQARIVAILDKFDKLVNSLCEGLPREIELRHKQYEYYRDQLLTFPAPE